MKIFKIVLLSTIGLFAQPDQDQLGSWYMYFWNTTFSDSEWGLQGDYQYRDWEILGDTEQLLIRNGVTYKPDGTNVKFTLGYAYIGTGAFGDIDVETINENRIYQEALLGQNIANRFFILHRFRFEQRFVDDQDFRTRLRYAIFINAPFNRRDLKKGALYLAFYNELFVNGQRGISDSRSVELFDRNRTYFGLGYSITDGLRAQLGWMRQLTDNWGKNQLQFSVLHQFSLF